MLNNLPASLTKLEIASPSAKDFTALTRLTQVKHSIVSLREWNLTSRAQLRSFTQNSDLQVGDATLLFKSLGPNIGRLSKRVKSINIFHLLILQIELSGLKAEDIHVSGVLLLITSPNYFDAAIDNTRLHRASHAVAIRHGSSTRDVVCRARGTGQAECGLPNQIAIPTKEKEKSENRAANIARSRQILCG